MTKSILRNATAGLLMAVPMLLAGISGGAAYAGQTDAATVRAEGTRVTTDPGTVTPMDAGNNNASVAGVPFCSNINRPADCWTWENGSQVDCPSAHFCIYTHSFATANSRVFSLYHCREYALSNWLDQGFVWNNNTGGAPGYLRGSNHATLPGGTFSAGEADWYNFYPVWYVKAC
jgi:hypothetical protein